MIIFGGSEYQNSRIIFGGSENLNSRNRFRRIQQIGVTEMIIFGGQKIFGFKIFGGSENQNSRDDGQAAYYAYLGGQDSGNPNSRNILSKSINQSTNGP